MTKSTTDIEVIGLVKKVNSKFVFLEWQAFTSLLQVLGLGILLVSVMYLSMELAVVVTLTPIGLYFAFQKNIQKIINLRANLIAIYFFCLLLPFIPFLLGFSTNFFLIFFNLNTSLLALTGLFFTKVDLVQE